jgi:hypothetical protein
MCSHVCRVFYRLIGDALLMYSDVVILRLHLPCFDVCLGFGVAGLGWYPCNRLKNNSIFLISIIRRVLNAVRFLLSNSPASEFYMPTFRKLCLFHLHRKVGMNYPEESIQYRMHMLRIQQFRVKEVDIYASDQRMMR